MRNPRYGRRLLAAVILFVCLAPTGLIRAQQEEKPGATHKVIRVEHADVRHLSGLLQNWAHIVASPELRILTVRGDPESVAAVEEAVRELDVPQAGAVGRGQVLKTFHLPNSNKEELASIMTAIRGLTDMQRMFPVTAMNAITVRGTPEQVAIAEQVIRDLDQVRPAEVSETVELIVYFLVVTDGDTSVPPVPKGPLQEVVQQLKSTLPYEQYGLLETLTVRALVHRQAEVSGIVPESSPLAQAPEGTAGNPTIYRFQVRIGGVSSTGKATMIQIAELHVGLRIPIQTGPSQVNYEDVGINTALDVADGKTVVVGKAGSQGSIRGLFVVLTARVVE